MKRRFFSVFVALALCLSLLPGTALAAGTTTPEASYTWYKGHSSDDPYIITNLADFLGFANIVNGTNLPNGTNQSNFFNKTVKLSQDINLNNVDWTPIGKDDDHPFKGTFDGNKKTISGLNVTGSTGVYYGLFGYVEMGTVKNLAVSGSISVETDASVWAGGVVGYCWGTIQDCQFSGSVRYSGNSDSYVGGVAGNAEQIENCCNTGSVNGGGNDSRVGGVVGRVYTIENSYNTGSVRGSGYVGGVAGFAGTVSDCYNTGNVRGKEGFVGGVAGDADQNITNSYNAGNVSGSGDVGGVAGWAATVTSCFYLTGTAGKGIGGDGDEDNTTPITAEKFANQGTFTGWDFNSTWVMSPFGRPLLAWEQPDGSEEKPYRLATTYELGKFRDLVNKGDTNYNAKHYQLAADLDLSGIDNWEPIGKDDPHAFKGTFDGNGKSISGLKIDVTGGDGDCYGLFGYVDTGGIVKNLAVSGSVSVTSNNDDVRVGGIVGHTNGTIQNCQFSGSVSGSGYVGGVAGYVDTQGSVTNSYNTGRVSGSGNVGGVVGSGSVSNSYNTGNVSGSGDNNSVGGVAGSGSVSKCFYLTGTADTGVGQGQDTATKITVVQLADKDTFTTTGVGWDFTNTWVMGAFRPLLAWEAAAQNAGTGDSANSPYKISTVSELEELSRAVNAGKDYSGKFFQLTADLDLEGITNWTPIGTDANSAFAGVFDGKGHTVSNLAIDVTTAGNYGLFGYSTGTVQNLAVNGKVSVTNADPVNVGGILGCNAGTLKSCYYVSAASGENGAVSRVVGTATDSSTTQNCFYLSDATGVGDVAGQVEAADTDRFKSGEVAWNLQNGQTTQIWGQTLRDIYPYKDDFPVPTSDTKKKVCQVAFNLNENTVYQCAYTNPYGTVAAPTTAPTQIGYTFDGWFESQTATDAFDFTTPITSDLTLIARWTLHENHDYVNGACSVCGAVEPVPPSSGGGSSRPSTPTITVPVSSETGSVTVKATVKNGNASIEISDKQINQVVAEGAKNVTVDLTGLKNVTSATLPAHVIETIGNAEDVGLTVALPTGTVSLDSTALSSLPAGEDITVSVKRVPATDLNEQQQAAVGDMANIGLVFDVEILVNGEQHTNLNGGTVTISIPYTPKKGENPHKMTVWYIRDDGMIMPMGGYYDEEKQCFVFEARELPLRVS